MKQFITVIILLSCLQLKAQDTSSFKFTSNHLALSVKDVNRSAIFYKEVMRLKEITNRSAIEGIRWFALSDDREMHLISIIKEPVTINKAIHLGLSSGNFDAFVENLKRLKITYSDWAGTPNTVNIRADGVKQVFFQDPDGYWLEVNNVTQ